MSGNASLYDIILMQNDEIKRLREQIDRLEQKLRDANIEIGAEWKINPNGWYPYCSNCGNEPRGGFLTNFCPECGVDMRGEKK